MSVIVGIDTGEEELGGKMKIDDDGAVSGKVVNFIGRFVLRLTDGVNKRLFSVAGGRRMALEDVFVNIEGIAVAFK